MVQASFKKNDKQKVQLSIIEQLLPMIRVFARMKPADKVMVIKLLQKRGWIVGMAGDGGRTQNFKIANILSIFIPNFCFFIDLYLV